MKLFECQNCGQPLYFENTSCESCGLRLGYLPERETVTALQAGRWTLAGIGGARSASIDCAPMPTTTSAIGSSPTIIPSVLRGVPP